MYGQIENLKITKNWKRIIVLIQMSPFVRFISICINFCKINIYKVIKPDLVTWIFLYNSFIKNRDLLRLMHELFIYFFFNNPYLGKACTEKK